MSIRYSPGDTPVVVTPLGFVVLAAGTPASLAARIRTLIADGRGLGGVIEALTEAYGASLTAIPPFAVALVEGESVRIVVRGDLTLAVESAAAADEISGAGVTTWTERVIPAVTRITVTPVTESRPAELPLGDGVVLASRIEWDAAPRPAVADPAPSGSPAFAPAAPAAPAAPEASAVPIEVPRPAVEFEPVEPVPVERVLVDPAAAVPASPTPGPEPEREPTPERAPAGFDELWGATIVRTNDEPLLRPAHDDEGADPGDEAVVIGGDHDGETITLAQARAMRAAHDAAAPDDANPPYDSNPSYDSAPAPLAMPRPPAPGRLRLSTGQTVMLDRTVVIGRRPRSTRVTGTDLPHLVAVESPQQDISRSHVELRVEGDSIVATDLRTTNGTTLLRAGADPMRLHPGEGTIVVAGDVLDLGDGITVAVDELP